MFGKKKHPEELENLIQKKINNNDKDFSFFIKEVKVKEKYEPAFKLYLNDNDRQREIDLFGHKVEGVQLYYISKFLSDLKEANKYFNITFKIEALMPQYNGMLMKKLEEAFVKRHSLIDATKIIKDINEENLDQLTVEQQKELFIDLCYAGNDAPLKKLLDFSIISKNGKALDVTNKKLFNKDDIIFGAERAAFYGYCNVVKTILESEIATTLIDFSDKSSNLLTVLDAAIRKERKDIVSYMLYERMYKLSMSELYYLRNNQKEPAFAEVLNEYEKKHLVDKTN